MVSMDLEELEDPGAFAREMKRLGAGELLLLASNGYDKKMEAVEAVKKQSELPVMISVTSLEDAEREAAAVKADAVAVHDAGAFSVLEWKRI